MLRIEPLNREHDITAFECTVVSFTNYLQAQAAQDQKRGNAAVYVMVDELRPETVLGYYTISPTQISTESLPKSYIQLLGKGRKWAPAFVLGKLAVDKRFTGNGYGEDLISHALEQALVRAGVGGTGVIIHALNERLANYYRSLGFVSHDSDPLTLYLPRGSAGLET